MSNIDPYFAILQHTKNYKFNQGISPIIQIQIRDPKLQREQDSMMNKAKNANIQNQPSAAAGVNGGIQVPQIGGAALSTPKHNARKSNLNHQGVAQAKDDDTASKQSAQILNSQQSSDNKGTHLKNAAATPSNASKSNFASSLGLTTSASFASSMTPNRSSIHKNIKYGMKHYDSNPMPSGHAHTNGSQRQSASTVLCAVNAQGQPQQHYLSIQLKHLQMQASKLEMQLEQSSQEHSDQTSQRSGASRQQQLQQKQRSQLDTIMQKMKIMQAQWSKKGRNPSANNQMAAYEYEQEHDLLLTVPDEQASKKRYYSEQSDFSLQSSDQNSKGSQGIRNASQALSTSSGQRKGSKGEAAAMAKEVEKANRRQLARAKKIGDEKVKQCTFVAEVIAPALGLDGEYQQEQTNPRKLSMDEKEFDNRLCNQVDQLLLTTSESINARKRKIAVEQYGPDQMATKKIKSGQVWHRDSVNSNEKNDEYAKTAQKKKKKKGRKKNKNQYDQIDNFKLRSRTETPSKDVNICMVASQQISEIEKQALLWQQDDDDRGDAKGMNQSGSVPRNTHMNTSDLNPLPDGFKKSFKEAPIPLLARMNARNTSPTKLLQKHLHRQQKAELLRTQIVQNKQKQLEKIRARQQDIKTRLNKCQEEIQQEKRIKLNDKIVHARENREIELTNIKLRAQQDLQGVEDTKLINQLTTNNLQLDIKNKLDETEDRRKSYFQSLMKKLEGKKLMEEEAHKRRIALTNTKLQEIKKAEIKRQMAQERKMHLIQQKQKAAEQNKQKKRAEVLQRKNTLGEKMSDVLSFVNDQDNVWDLIGNEESFKDNNENQKDIFKLGLKKKDDLLNLKKQELIQDAAFLNKIMSFDEDGKMFVKLDRGDYQHLQRLMKGNDYLDNSSSDTSEAAVADSGDDQSPTRSRRSNISSNKIRQQFLKGRDLTNQSNSSYHAQHIDNTPPKGALHCDKKTSSQVMHSTVDAGKEHVEGARTEATHDQNFDRNSDDLASFDDGSCNCSRGGELLQQEHQADHADLGNDLNADDQRSSQLSVGPKSFSQNANKENDKNHQNINGTTALTIEALNEFNMQTMKSLEPSQMAIHNNPSENGTHNQPTQQFSSQPIITDEEEQMMLIESRIHYSIKRNILRDTMSEDLEWALCIHNDDEDFFDRIRQNITQQQNLHETRSLISTPERKNSADEFGGAIPRERSCEGRLFGSASSRRRFKKSSRLNSRRSSISSQGMYKSLQKSKSRDNILLDSKSLQMLNKEGSGKNKRTKRDNSRDSYDSHRILARSSIGSIQPRNLFQHGCSVSQSGFTSNLFGDDLAKKDDAIHLNKMDQGQAQTNDYGSQMNKLITTMKPKHSYQPSKSKLSANAQKLLFPICEQMILFKRPGIHGQFVNARITIKLEDMQTLMKNPQQQLNPPEPQKSSSAQQVGNVQQKEKSHCAITEESASESTQTKQSFISPSVGSAIVGAEKAADNLQKSTLAQSNPNGLTPQDGSTNAAKESQMDAAQSLQQYKESAVKYFLSGQFNDQLKNEDPLKSIEISNDNPAKLANIQQLLDRLERKDFQFYYCRLCECILSEGPLESSITAVPEKKEVDKVANPQDINNQSQVATNVANTPPQPTEQAETNDQQNQAAVVQGPSNQAQSEAVNAQQTENAAEEVAAPTHANDFLIYHIQSNKNHKKMRDELGIKEIEDQTNSILYFGSTPGDISKELLKEKEKALRRKVKGLKVQLQQMAISHDNASQNMHSWKDYSSLNKKTLQIRCLDLEKQVNPSIRDYDALEQNLKEILKLLQIKNQGDLMLFRKLKFIPSLVDICKRIQICHRQDIKNLGKAIELSIKIISIFCTQRENRNYMLQTNRIIPLMDLLIWCMNRPTQLFFGISFLPQLYQLITIHIKHRVPYECLQSKEYLIEMFYCSSILMKIKLKFSIINYPMTLGSQSVGQVPLFLLKSITFIESLTSIIGMDARYRPVYERSSKIGEHHLFVIENTELFGVIQMIATLLLTHSEQFKTSSHNTLEYSDQNAVTKVMPQTFLSISIISIKVLNNSLRMDVKFVQQLLVKNEFLSDKLYHLLNYLLVYAQENYDKCEDTKELLHETLLFIGYFCLDNEHTQAILSLGENTIMQKLCNLPFPYFTDKKLKEILFPTLIQASYMNERCVAIMNQEMAFEPLIKFLQDNMKEELPRIMEEEFDYQSISSLGDIGGGIRGLGRQKNKGRSPSISSHNSSGCSIQIESISNGNCPYLPLFMRFPKNKWATAIEFYQKLCE